MSLGSQLLQHIFNPSTPGMNRSEHHGGIGSLRWPVRLSPPPEVFSITSENLVT